MPIDGLDRPSVVAANLVQSLAWREREARPITTAEPGVLEQVLLRIIPLVGVDRVLDQYIEP